MQVVLESLSEYFSFQTIELEVSIIQKKSEYFISLFNSYEAFRSLEHRQLKLSMEIYTK